VHVEGKNILNIEEKPVHKFFVSGGVYVLDPKILSFIPDDIFYDMPTLFEDLINADETPISFPVHEYWLDIGQISQLQQAREEYFSIFEDEN